MKTKILAVMFTDIVGYTQRTSRQTYEQNAALLAQHAAIVHPIVRDFGGRVVKEIGDAVLAVFASPTRAAEAAMAVQDRLAELNRARPADEQLHLRIAVNVGEVRTERRDVFGEGVNVAARLEAETPVDQIYVSGATYLTMNRTGIPFQFVGQRQLKGIAEPVTVFALPRFAPEAGVEIDATDAELPYHGRQLVELRARRRRRVVALAALAAGVAALATLGGLSAARAWQTRRAQQEVVVAAQARDWRRAIEQLAALVERGPGAEQQTTALVAALGREADPAAACLAFDRLVERVALDPTQSEGVARLRLMHSFALLRRGELAHARLCLEAVAVAVKAPEARVLQLSRVHLAALEALRARDANALFEELRRYQEFLRAGSAPEDHLLLLAEVVADAYAYPKTRPLADSLVVDFLGSLAAPALAERAVTREMAGVARSWIIGRLERVAGGAALDWTAVYAAQLDDKSCLARRNAIEQIHRQGRLSTAGLLLREAAKSDACTRAAARQAAYDLVANGDPDLPPSAGGLPLVVATR